MVENIDRKDIGVIYFIGSPNTDGVKNGHSKRFDLSRIDDHLGLTPFGFEGGPGAVEVLALWRGTDKEHKDICTYLEEQGCVPWKPSKPDRKTPVEMFKSDETIKDYIAWLREQVYVSHNNEEFSYKVNELRPSSEWFPNKQRVSKIRVDTDCLVPVHEGWRNIFVERKHEHDDYYTPHQVIDAVRACFGGVIDLDAASNMLAQEYIQALDFFSPDRNGLAIPWSQSGGNSNVWLSPPNATWEAWEMRACEQFSAGGIRQMLVIVGARQTTSNYLDRMMQRANAHCILRREDLRWTGKGGVTHSKTTEGYIVLYFSRDTEAEEIKHFRTCFNHLGSTWEK